MTEEKLVQTTLRIDQETLYEARHYLNLEGLSIARFLKQTLEDFVQEYRKAHPERAPRGHEGHP